MRLRWILILAVMFFAVLHPNCAGAAPSGERASDLAEIKSIRVGVTAERVRIVADASQEVNYKTLVLSSPGRVVVDLFGARLGAKVMRSQALQTPYASRVRVAQFDKTTVRIVIETEAKKGGFDVFSVEGGSAPYRVVVDVGKIAALKPSEKDAANVKKDVPTEKDDDSNAKDTDSSLGSEEEEREPDSSADEDMNDPKNEKGSKGAAAEKDIQELVFTPGLKGKKICIDPGHGGEDPGAIGPTGVMEKNITLKIAKEVQRLLQAAGAKVIMTRTADTEVSPKHRHATDVDELQARCDVANKAKADVFISIHMDSFLSKGANGTSGYYYVKSSAASRRLAACVQQNVVSRIETESRGVKSCNFYVVKHTKMPATLIEVAFVSNPKEEKLLNSAPGVKQAAAGIVQGLSDFFDN